MPSGRKDQMTKTFRIQFTATTVKRSSHDTPREDDVPTSLVIVSLLSLNLLLFCRFLSALMQICGLGHFAHFFDTAFVSFEIVIKKLHYNFKTNSLPRIVHSRQCADLSAYLSGGSHKHPDSFVSTASNAATELTDSRQISYQTSPERLQSTPEALGNNDSISSSASVIMNDKESSNIAHSSQSPTKATTPQKLLLLLPTSSPFPDPFSLTASQRAEIIERARRDSQSENASPEQCCNDRNHLRRQCCSPTPVGNLMEKAEKMLHDKARSPKSPRSPYWIGVGSGNILRSEKLASKENSSPAGRKGWNNSSPFSDSYSDGQDGMFSPLPEPPGYRLVIPRTRKGGSSLDETTDLGGDGSARAGFLASAYPNVRNRPWTWEAGSQESVYSNVRDQPWTPEDVTRRSPVSKKESLNNFSPMRHCSSPRSPRSRVVVRPRSESE
ncbi:hypothetical protein MMC16_004695 [Acarospora aff. strigata]|nr:hypothetical protein [Acarospora aff. strigata]